jgi:hypothetical protein
MVNLGNMPSWNKVPYNNLVVVREHVRTAPDGSLTNNLFLMVI